MVIAADGASIAESDHQSSAHAMATMVAPGASNAYCSMCSKASVPRFLFTMALNNAAMPVSLLMASRMHRAAIATPTAMGSPVKGDRRRMTTAAAAPLSHPTRGQKTMALVVSAGEGVNILVNGSAVKREKLVAMRRMTSVLSLFISFILGNECRIYVFIYVAKLRKKI